MARIRYVKPEFFSDTRIADLSLEARYFYIGLFCQMDCNGVLEDDMKLIKREVFPYDEDITTEHLEILATELLNTKRLFRFEHQGKRFFVCPSFPRHQKFHQGERPKYVIPKKTLLEACLHGADPVLAGFGTPTSSIGIGIGIRTGTGIGIGIETGMGTGEGDRPRDDIPDEIYAANEKLIALRGRQTSPLGGWNKA